MDIVVGECVASAVDLSLVNDAAVVVRGVDVVILVRADVGLELTTLK